MLHEMFIWLIFLALGCGSTLTADHNQCPGNCLPLEAPCKSPSEKLLCSKELKCCLDESKGATTESEPYAISNTDAEAEMRSLSLFEIEESAKDPLISLLSEDPVEALSPDNATAYEEETVNNATAYEEEPRKCPGICVSKLDEPFCPYPFRLISLCGNNQICCLNEKQAFKIRTLVATSVEDPNSEAAAELRDIFKRGEIGDLESLNCQHHCLLRRHIRRCRQRFDNYYCPGTSICCDEDTSQPIELFYEKCEGKCVPPQLQFFCKPPQILTPTKDCDSPTLCCERRQMSERSGYQPYFEETDKFSYRTEENFTLSEEGESGKTWMVADPQNRLWEQYKLETSDGPLFGIPVSQESEFFIPDETEAQSEADLPTRPLCPGSCMSYFTRFLCFRNYSTYEGFYCPGRSVCCAKIEDIKKHEEFLKATYPFLQGNFRELNPNCGRKGRKEETPKTVPGEWCWQAAVLDAHNQYVCGGALIDKSWVITTAQCIAGYVSQNQPVFIRAGVNDLSNAEDNAAGQTRPVSSTYLHYSYDMATLDNDIALLKLQKPVTLDNNVCLACLPTRLTLPREGSLCTITGYAFVSDDEEMSLRVTEAQVPLLHDVDCISNLTQALSTVYILPASSFCAGHEKNYCQGASGNPLVCRVDDHYELTGLVSWSVGCHLPDAPSVFMKISALLGWINHVMDMDQQLYSENL